MINVSSVDGSGEKNRFVRMLVIVVRTVNKEQPSDGM